jgi:hypothetical protein
MIPHTYNAEELAKIMPEPPEELRPVLYGAGAAGGLVGLSFIAQSVYDVTVTYPQLVATNTAARESWDAVGKPNLVEAAQIAYSNQTVQQAVDSCVASTVDHAAVRQNITLNADGSVSIPGRKLNPEFQTCVGQAIAPPKAYHDAAVDGVFLGLTVALTAAAVGFYGAHRKERDETAPASTAVAGITANLS